MAGAQRGDLLSLLDGEERERHSRLRFAKHQADYLAAHVLLRLTLSRYVDLPPSAWIIERKAHGRPEIANRGVPPLRFNLTHTDGLSACVVTLNDDCGIDAEQLGAPHDLEAVSRRMFSPAEASELEQLEGDIRLKYFYSRWTLREAYVKARGTGLSLGTRKIHFDVDPDQRVTAEFSAELNDDASRWQFKLLNPGSSYVMSVALASGKTIVGRQFDPGAIAQLFT